MGKKEENAKKNHPKKSKKPSKDTNAKKKTAPTIKATATKAKEDDDTRRGCCWGRSFDAEFKTRKDWYTIQTIELPRIIRYLAFVNFGWEIIMYCLVITHYLMVTYGCFFTYYQEVLWDVVYACDCIFALDVIMRLSVEMWRYYYQSDVLPFNIPYSFSHCVLDLISLFPLLNLACALSDLNSFKVLSTIDYFRLNSFMRLRRAFIFFDALEVRRLFSDEVLFLFRFSNIYLALINSVSCIFFLLVDVEPLDFLLWRKLARIDRSWARFYKRKKPDYGQQPFDLYILSTHFSTATVTTVGYGDLHGETELEMIICVVIMLIGAIFMNGYFISQITTFQLELDSARFDLFFRLEGILRQLDEIGMSAFFQSKVQLYYKCLWTYREGVDHVTFIDHLPRSLQEDVYYNICLEMFHKSYLFRDLDEAFLRAVSKIVRISMFNPGMILCRYGSYANQMYYILQGECQAMSKHDSSKKAAVLRAGSIIGENNLFFSYPFSCSVETRTCCQCIFIDKEELMTCFSKFPIELTILRSRCQVKVKQMYDAFQIFGEDPICWVQRERGAQTTDSDSNKKSTALPTSTVGRWGQGFNFKVTDDVIADTDSYVIFETLCQDKKYAKNHVTPYMTCVVPEILNSSIMWIHYWNGAIMVFALLYSFVGPYCYAFGGTSFLQHYICGASKYYFYFNAIIFLIDVFVEIIGACPVEGLYFQIKDGLNVKSKEVLFYFDILAAIPLEFIPSEHEHDWIPSICTILKSIKVWKVIRYLRFLDNVYPRRLFWFRLGQTFLVLMYGIHFIACGMFYIACNDDDSYEDFHVSSSSGRHEDHFVCSDNTWIASYKISALFEDKPVKPEFEPNELSKSNAYVISFYFSAATLTSAGFGDFNPQNKSEIVLTIIFQLIGFFLIGYYTALLTSALTCVVKPRLEFQQKMLSVKRFMKHAIIPEALQRRVIEHFMLQHQLHNGVNLPADTEHYLYDSPDYIKNDVLYTDVVLLLDGIPLFSKADSRSVIKMSERMKRYLIPPNATFLHIGEVRRSMYAIRHGSMGVFDGKAEFPLAILESTAYFGIRDLIFGEPSHFNYVTLSYCIIYEITEKNFNDVFEDDDELNEYLNIQRELLKKEVDEMCRTYSRLRREARKDRAMEIPSWIHYEPSTTNKKKQIKYKEYCDYFKEFRGGKFFRYFLMNQVIHPCGVFAALWTSWMSLIACTILCLIVIETFMYYRPPGFRIAQLLLDGCLYVDIYVRFHWAYYLQDGLMVTHPLKTAALYILEGSFILDIMTLAHPELLLWIFGYTTFLGYGMGATWYTKLRWIRFIQIKRVQQIFEIIHTIFVWRNALLFALYVSMTIVMGTMMAAVALAIGCPWSANNWNEGDEYKLPFCQADSWAVMKGDVMSQFSNRWVVGLYYVCQAILVIGFGDMTTLNIAEVYLLIFMSVFGFIFMRCVVADITAAEVDSDEVRSNYIDQMKRIIRIMHREKVAPRIILNVREHLENNWKQSKGLQPRILFSDLHPAIESDLYRAFVGNRLNKVPLFEGFAPNVLRHMCKYVKKLYFLSGERITRFGNLEYHMYIIVSGKVWVTDRFLNYGCTLHKNETFGESGVSEIPRRFTTVAAENVEVFAISHTDFQIVLNRYPVIKEILNIRTGNGHFDFFENKIYDMIDWLKNLKGDEKDRRIDVLVARTQVVKHLVYSREPPDEEDVEALKFFHKKKKRYFISFGTEDDGLPLFYFVSQRSRRTGMFTLFPPLIHPNCIFMSVYLELVYLVCLLISGLSVYEVCFPHYKGFEDDVSKCLRYASDVMLGIMMIFILLKFFIPYEDEEGNFVKNSRCVAINYLGSITGIWLDIFAAIPPLFISPTIAIESNSDDGDDKKFNYSYFKLFRMLWLYRYYKHHFSKRDDLSISAFKFKIKISVTTFCMMAHILACVFYRISKCRRSKDGTYKCDESASYKGGSTWTSLLRLEEKSNIGLYGGSDISPIDDAMQPWRWWIRSLYWVVTVVSTTGFGDITPQTVTEMIMGIIAVFCGAFILSIILSHFTAGMASLTKAHREYLYQVKLLVKYLRNIGLSVLRQEQVQLYFETVWNNLRGDLYHMSASVLPPSLQIEVSYALFEPVLKQVKFFKTADAYFLRQLANRVSHYVFLPGVCIVKEGDQGNMLFIVYKGRVCGFVEGQQSDNQLKSMYLVGDTFGRFPALFFDEWYKKSYRAEEYTEVLAIRQYDLLILSKIYEDLWKLLVTYIDRKYDPNGEADCIFSQSNRAKTSFTFDGRGSAHVKRDDKVNKERQKDSKKKVERRRQKEGARQAAAQPAPGALETRRHSLLQTRRRTLDKDTIQIADIQAMLKEKKIGSNDATKSKTKGGPVSHSFSSKKLQAKRTTGKLGTKKVGKGDLNPEPALPVPAHHRDVLKTDDLATLSEHRRAKNDVDEEIKQLMDNPIGQLYVREPDPIKTKEKKKKKRKSKGNSTQRLKVLKNNEPTTKPKRSKPKAKTSAKTGPKTTLISPENQSKSKKKASSQKKSVKPRKL